MKVCGQYRVLFSYKKTPGYADALYTLYLVINRIELQ